MFLPNAPAVDDDGAGAAAVRFVHLSEMIWISWQWLLDVNTEIQAVQFMLKPLSRVQT